MMLMNSLVALCVQVTDGSGQPQHGPQAENHSTPKSGATVNLWSSVRRRRDVEIARSPASCMQAGAACGACMHA